MLTVVWKHYIEVKDLWTSVQPKVAFIADELPNLKIHAQI